MKSQLTRFLFKTTLFIVPVLIFFELLFRLGFSPIITNSTLFDYKMMVVQKRHVKNVKLLSIGSSLALYELNSKIIVQNIPMPYYNFASWGLQITDMKLLLPGFIAANHPKYVIICSSFPDFITPSNDSYLNYINTSGFIKNNFPEFFYFKNYNSIHQVVRRKFNAYPVALDNWGGAALNIKQKDTAKWNLHDVFPTKYTPGNYKALDSIGAYLEAQNIRFIFIQVPIKKSYTNTGRAKQIIQSHFDTCKLIVEKHNGIYLNYYNTTIFTDGLFIDQYHLQDAGSLILTKEIVGDLKKVIKE